MRNSKLFLVWLILFAPFHVSESAASSITQPALTITDAFGYLNLPGATFRSINGSGIGSGQVDLYTAPAGKRALMMGSFSSFNPTVGAITLLPELKLGGNYYRLTTATANTNAASATNVNSGSIFVLEPGDGFSVNTSAAGLNVFIRVMEFPATYPFYSPRLTTFAASTNTLYTVPSGASAVVLASTFGAVFNPAGDLLVSNQSGAGITSTINIVPSGGSPGTGNQQSPTSATANNAIHDFALAATMTAGDFINVTSNSATAGQLAYVTVVETVAN